MRDYISKEPVRFWSSVTTFVQALIALLLIFDIINWNEDQIAAVMAFVAALGGMVMFFYVRNSVTPMTRPRGDDGGPLVPIALDGYED